MTTARKIAHVPALAGLYAMPASYDPAAIARDDAEHDSAICGAAEELATLRARAKATSDMARSTSPVATEEALAELDAIDEQWGDAIDAARLGDVAGIREALEQARLCSKTWGATGEEDAALALLGDNWTNDVGTYRADGSFVPR